MAAVVLAFAAVMIPAVLDFQQRESLAKNATIEHYQRVFDSQLGQDLEDIAAEGEIFYWEKWNARRAQYEALPTDTRKEFRIREYRKIDSAWRDHLFENYDGEHGLRKLAIFLLLQADVVYECAGFREYFKHTQSGDQKFRWGALIRDDSRRLVHPGKTYFDIIGDFLRDFSAARETGFICHRDSLNQLFGRWFSAPFWYLRTFLYCDDFLRQNFFREKDSDGSPLYRLESVAMVIDQIDMEFRYPDDRFVVMRTNKEIDDSDTQAYSFRLDADAPGACL